MYLPDEIPGAKVLITVKTYPQPSNKYHELVCTAGFFDEKWIRLYPVPFRALPYKDQYSKYHWVTLDLVRNYSDLGALYWNCLNQCGGNEEEANKLVKAKYFDYFCSQRDVYLFMGTTQLHHFKPRPFIIIGVFWPPKLDVEQLSLFD